MKNEKLSRSENSVRNVTVSVVVMAVTTFVSFINRMVFAHNVPVQYLGLNGLFSNILGYMLLSELGIGSAVTYALYKPIKDKDDEKIKSLMRELQKLYLVVAGIVLFLGILLLPWIGVFVKEDTGDIPYLKIYYLLFLINQIVILLITCKRILIICNQKEYIISILSGVFQVFSSVLQIFIILRYGSYLGYLVVALFMTILEGIYTVYLSNRLFPILREKEVKPLNDEDKSELNKNIRAIALHRVGLIMVGSTDNIIISKFVGLIMGGLYSNYVIIIDVIKRIIMKIFAPLAASVGNLMIENDKEHSEKVLYHMLFLNEWICGFSSACLICLLQPFIRIWLGREFIIDDAIIYIAVLCFYVNMIRVPLLIFRDASGVFDQDKYRNIIQGIVNLVFSLVLVRVCGIVGVIMGTIISDLTVAVWLEAKVFFKVCFDKGIRKYMHMQLRFFFLNSCVVLLTLFLCHVSTNQFVESNNWIVLIIRTLICVVIPNTIYLGLFHKSESFKYFYSFAGSMIKKMKAT